MNEDVSGSSNVAPAAAPAAASAAAPAAATPAAPAASVAPAATVKSAASVRSAVSAKSAASVRSAAVNNDENGAVENDVADHEEPQTMLKPAFPDGRWMSFGSTSFGRKPF